MPRPISDKRRVQLYLDPDTLSRLDRWAEEHGVINERGEYSRSLAVESLVKRATRHMAEGERDRT